MAAPTLSEDVLSKVTTEAAETFTDGFYNALNNARHAISSYYSAKDTLPDGKKVPTIFWNGNEIEDGQAFQDMFKSRMPFTHFDVQSLDCDYINLTAAKVLPQTPKDAERSMSILVTVSGYVRLEEASKGPMKGFSESFVLIPNPDKTNLRTSKDRRGWLIQSQNFRYVVDTE